MKKILILMLLAGLAFADCSNTTGSVAFSYWMSANNSLLPRNYLTTVFNGSVNNSSCFYNYTAYLTYLNGTLVQAVSSTENNTTELVFSPISLYYDANGHQLPYLHYVVLNFNNSSAQTETRQYFFTQATSFGTNDMDSIAMGTIFSFALLALLFFYLHAHSEGEVWAHAWLFFGCLMTLVDLLAITYFAQQDGATAIANVGLAMVVIFAALFGFSMLIFIYTVAFSLLLSVKKMLRL